MGYFGEPSFKALLLGRQRRHDQPDPLRDHRAAAAARPPQAGRPPHPRQLRPRRRHRQRRSGRLGLRRAQCRVRGSGRGIRRTFR